MFMCENKYIVRYILFVFNVYVFVVLNIDSLIRRIGIYEFFFFGKYIFE